MVKHRYEPLHANHRTARPRQRCVAASHLGRSARVAPLPASRPARDSYGPNSVGVFSCSKSTNEMNYVAQKFARVAIGTNNIDSCNRT